MARRLGSGITGKPILGSLSVDVGTIEPRKDNTDIAIVATGTGAISLSSNTTIRSGNSLKFNNNANSHSITLGVSGGFTSDLTYTLPSAVTADYFLKTDANGTLSWAEAAVAVSNQTADTSEYYPVITTTTSGTLTTVNTSNTKLKFVPSSGTLTANVFSGVSSTLTGTLTAASIVETSSIAYKENVTPIQNALDAIVQLNGVTYDRKDGSSVNEAGLIKEEVEKIIPNIVSGDGIQYTKLTAYLIEALKTVIQDVEKLKGTK